MTATGPGGRMAITAEVRDALRRAARGGERERCGLLFGPPDGAGGDAVATVCVELPNERDAADAFALDPGRVVAAAREQRARGLALVATWHTHLGGGPAASAADLACCGDGWRVVIAAGEELAAHAAGDGRAMALRVLHDPA